MINYGAQSINRRDIKAVEKVLLSPWLTQGPTVRAFEETLAGNCGARYAVAVSSGTVALHLAYLVAGLKKGDEVITTPNTFVATVNMLMAVGAKPVFCDIRSDTYNLDETKIESLITKKTRAIVSVDFAGQPCEYKKICTIARRHKLLVIEDACHALGAKYYGQSIGTWADMTVLSFHAVKPITTGEGGAILTSSKNFYERLILLRSHGVNKDQDGFNVMVDLGYNYRLTNFQSALGSSQLKRLDSFLKKRRAVAQWYRQKLAGVDQVILPLESKNVLSGWHLYVIRTRDARQRLPLYKYLREQGIGASFHYPCVYQHPFYQKKGFSNVKCPTAEKYAATAITLPLHVLLTHRDILFITKTIKSFFQK